MLSNIDEILERVMCNRLHEFLKSHNLIYDLQFGFRQKHCTFLALIHLIEKIREQLGKGSSSRGIFVDFQKAFDTVDHDILIRKLNYYGVRATTNSWFSSYLENRAKIASIYGYLLNLDFILCSVPKGCILGLLLFLIYINDLQFAIKHCKVHHFANDTNLLQ